MALAAATGPASGRLGDRHDPDVRWTTDAELNITSSWGHSDGIEALLGDEEARAAHEEALGGTACAYQGTLGEAPCLFHLAPLVDGGAVRGVQGAGYRRHRADREAVLEELVEELDAFAHATAHDLRAPLRAMKGFSEVLLADASGMDPGSRHLLTRIHAAGHRMDRTIEGLLQYARLARTDIRLGRVSLDVVVHDALSACQAQCDHAGARVLVGRPLPDVMGHPTLLVQALTNLVSNAVKFVPPSRRPRVRIGAKQQGERVMVYVEDNGIGIAPEHQRQVFRPFERLQDRRRYEGSGIGLALVQRVATRLGGRAGVASRPGEGSRFWIEVPSCP